jgi:CheY-like chemotaxis protein
MNIMPLNHDQPVPAPNIAPIAQPTIAPIQPIPVIAQATQFAPLTAQVIAPTPLSPVTQTSPVIAQATTMTQAIPGQLPLQGLRVLCIEDEFFIGELYTRALVRVGATVKLIITGDEGLKEALTNNYDVILLDMMIPNLPGDEVLDQLRANPGFSPKTKIIFVTNTQQPDNERLAVEAKVDGYFIKAEITPKQLVQAIIGIL